MQTILIASYLQNEVISVNCHLCKLGVDLEKDVLLLQSDSVCHEIFAIFSGKIRQEISPLQMIDVPNTLFLVVVHYLFARLNTFNNEYNTNELCVVLQIPG